MNSSVMRMFRMSFRSLIFIFAMLFSTVGLAQNLPTPHSVDSLKTELANATNPADSVEILHNLYDCFYFDERPPLLYQIYETAERAKDYDSMLETLFMLTVVNLDDPAMEQKLIDMAKRAPESDIQKAYILYIKIRYQVAKLSKASEEERKQKLHQALKEYRSYDSHDIFGRIQYLLLICTNLRNSADSKYLIDYLSQLQTLVEQLPKEELAIRTMVYTLTVDSYIENELYDKAFVANKRILEIIGQFDKLHEAQGRIFRNYDGSLYSCYHNMLICASELTDEEVDKYYNMTLEIAKRNPRIRADKNWETATRAYYLMAKKRYSEAIPLLKDRIRDNNTNNSQRLRYAKLLTHAAREANDKDALLEASQIIHSSYMDRLMAKPDVSLSELQTIYDVESLKDRNRDLDNKNQVIEMTQRNQGLIIVTVAAVIVICILAWLINLYVHSRWLAKRLSDSNKKLIDERNSHSEIYAKLVNLRDKAKAADKTKSNFVENLSAEIKEPLEEIVECSHLIADYANGEDKSYIRDYSNALSINTDLLIRLVNDILDLPKLESGELSIQRTHCSVKDICNFSLEVIKKHVAPGVEVVFTNTGSSDTKIFTDPQRVEQILIQILTNAAKFTEYGSITFGYDINPGLQTIKFTVTDTGIGLPEGVEEKIFKRFVKIDPTSQGNGLGLYIGRLLANMLGGTLALDPSYRDGARFTLTIPMK